MFFYPRHDVNVQPDPNIWEFEPDRYPAKMAGEYFAQRLRGIDLAAKADERF